MTGFQTAVRTQPAPAVAGDFASANPYFTFDAGPGGLVAGPAGLTVGVFAWVSPYPSDPDGTGIQAGNVSTGGLPAGFVHREQRASITVYLAETSMLILPGMAVALLTGGDVWVKNDGTTQATPGMKAFANRANGKVRFAVTGSAATVSGSGTVVSIAAASGTMTGSIQGKVLKVTSGPCIVGGTISGTDGTGTIITGTKVVSQISGTAGGTGTYGLSIDNGVLNQSSAGWITETYGIMTVGGTATGAFSVGQQLGGTGVAANTTITALGTGTGGAGTYYLDNNTAMSASAVTGLGDVETKWLAMSAGAAGELVKMSDHATG